MPISPVPERIYSSVYDLKPDELRQEGIRVILADLDNTLARYAQKEPDQETIAWKNALEAGGVRLFVVSNSRKPTRVSRFCEALGIDYIGHAGKPKKKGFLRALNQLGVQPQEAAMIGDQIFTDILGANNAQVHSWLMQPVKLDTLPRWIRFGIEWPFRALCPEDRRKKKRSK